MARDGGSRDWGFVSSPSCSRMGDVFQCQVTDVMKLSFRSPEFGFGVVVSGCFFISWIF